MERSTLSVSTLSCVIPQRVHRDSAGKGPDFPFTWKVLYLPQLSITGLASSAYLCCRWATTRQEPKIFVAHVSENSKGFLEQSCILHFCTEVSSKNMKKHINNKCHTSYTCIEWYSIVDSMNHNAIPKNEFFCIEQVKLEQCTYLLAGLHETSMLIGGWASV